MVYLNTQRLYDLRQSSEKTVRKLDDHFNYPRICSEKRKRQENFIKEYCEAILALNDYVIHQLEKNLALEFRPPLRSACAEKLVAKLSSQEAEAALRICLNTDGGTNSQT